MASKFALFDSRKTFEAGLAMLVEGIALLK